MLGTDAETVSDLVHVTPDVITIDDCCTRCWCVQTCTEREREREVSRGGVSEERWSTSEYGDGGGLASSIVTQESSDLTLIHVQIQTIHCQLLSSSSEQPLHQSLMLSHMNVHTEHISNCKYRCKSHRNVHSTPLYALVHLSYLVIHLGEVLYSDASLSVGWLLFMSLGVMPSCALLVH